MPTTKRKTKKRHSKHHKHSPRSKKKVKDIAAMFGSQISAKKVVKRVPKTKSRRNSETLRIQRKKLKKSKGSKKKSKHRRNKSTVALNPRTDHSQKQNDEFETDIDTNALQSIVPMNDEIKDEATDMYDLDYDIEHCDFDAFIKETYGTPKHSRKWSQSSFLSSVSALSLDLDDMQPLDLTPIDLVQQDARSSVCGDTAQIITENALDIDYKEQIEQNRQLSEQITHTNDGITTPMIIGEIGAIKTSDFIAHKNIHSHFEISMDLCDIGEIGAIKTSDYVKTPKSDTAVNDIFASSQYYIDSEDEYYSGQEMYTFDIDSNKQISAVSESAEVNHTNDTNNANEISEESSNVNGSFHERRESQIGMDLMDLMMSDSSSACDESEDESIHKCNDMCISELLVMFGLFLFSDRNIYSYFSDVLCIRYVYQMMDILPYRIRRPKDCFNLKQLRKVNRLVKYVSVQCRNNVWNGKYSKQWTGLESNYIYNIWQCKSEYLMNKSEYSKHYKSITSSHKSDIISLNGFERKYTHFLDINQFGKGETVLKLILKDLPNKYRLENKLFKFGIETNDAQSLYICDRLNIRMNDRYLECMFLDKFVENSSFVFMKLKTIQSKDGRFLNINFCHEPNMQITRFDHSEFSKDFQIQIQQNTQNCKVFLEQFSGKGQYIIEKL